MQKKLYILLSCIPLMMHGNVAVWNGQLPDNASYIDTNINITGDTTLGEGLTTVSASSSDVTIYVSEKAKVYSNDNSQSTLVLEAIAPFKLTIIVAKTLKFAGVANQLYNPIIIEERGDGTIEWIIEEDSDLVLGSENNRGGTILQLVLINETMPHHIFKPRLHHNQIKIERHSRIGFKDTNASGPLLQYALIDALNDDWSNHATLIQFSDGAAIQYERQ